MYNSRATRYYEDGRSFEQRRELVDAERSYKKAIGINSDYFEAHNNLGSVLLSGGRLEEAVQSFRRAVDIYPTHPLLLSNLGNALQAQGVNEEAIRWLTKAIVQNPDFADAHYNLGNAFIELNEIDEATCSYQKAIECNPKHRYAHHGLGNALSAQGEIDMAIAAYRKSIELNPGLTQAHRSLSKNRKFCDYDDDIRAMDALYLEGGLSSEQKMHLVFALGKAYEDIGEFGKAIDYFCEATSLKRASLEYSISEAEALFEKIKVAFPAASVADQKSSGNSDPTPIFIVGMPRSGTSLVEQILASHPEVFGAGELFVLQDLVGEVSTKYSLGDYPGCFYGMDSGIYQELGSEYIARIRRFSNDARYITDKMPHNFLRIGLIKRALPGARIIHCSRSPMDNCLSLFKNYFAAGHNYSYDMTELGQYYKLYLGLMQYWRDTLPGSFYELNYESLVTDQEDQVRQLLSYCNLLWHDACLDFHKTNRKIGTASNAQVRRRIYTDSVGLWERYGNQLGPLREAIDGYKKSIAI